MPCAGLCDESCSVTGEVGRLVIRDSSYMDQAARGSLRNDH